MSEPTLCCRAPGGHCDRCDLLVGLEGLHVIAVERDDGSGRAGLAVTVASAPGPMGCPRCGVVAHAHGRVEVHLLDAPAMGRPVRIVWRKRRWVCPEPTCPVGSFMEQDERVAAPRARLTTRACWWVVEQIRREHASVNGLRRQLGTSWRTVWEAAKPLLQQAADQESRIEGVTTLGVDEHAWHHVSTKPIEDGGRGPKELTGMVDLTRHEDKNGNLVVRARLLDLVPGRSGEAYQTWLVEGGETFRAGVEIATLDPSHGYKNAIRHQHDQLQDARAVRMRYSPKSLTRKLRRPEGALHAEVLLILRRQAMQPEPLPRVSYESPHGLASHRKRRRLLHGSGPPHTSAHAAERGTARAMVVAILSGSATDAQGACESACLVVRGRPGRVLLHRLDAVEGTCLGLIGLARGDNLAVACLEPEPELIGLVLVQLELTRHDDSSSRWKPGVSTVEDYMILVQEELGSARNGIVAVADFGHSHMTATSPLDHPNV